MLTVAIIGRPNVGKSTLFNRLIKKKMAIVDNTPGVTRDWQVAEGQLFDMKLNVMDTAGLEDTLDDSIQGRMRSQTERAMEKADVWLFMIDVRAGLTSLDMHFAKWLRRQDKDILICMNKCEKEELEIPVRAEAYRLGLGEPIPLSAEHGIGMDILYQELIEYEKKYVEQQEQGGDDELDTSAVDLLDNIDEVEGDEDFDFAEAFDIKDDTHKPIKVAIVGRPNAGKSTLLNAVVHEHRMMTGPEAGITRDSVSTDWEYNGRRLRLVDTAGIRKRAKIKEKLEDASSKEAFRSIRLAQVIILVIDANMPMEKQDVAIASHALNEGRALVIAVNKWDSVKGKKDILELINEKLAHSLSQVKNLPYVCISALNEHKIDKLMDVVIETFDKWNKRVPTSPLNRWVKHQMEFNPPPLVKGRSNKMRYMTQIKSKPPTFALWVSRPDGLPSAYERYLINGLYKDFDMSGIPIRILVRTSKNPYKD